MKFCVIGLGGFGYQVAVSLAEQGMEVLAIDADESIIASIRDKVTQAVCMKVKDKESLQVLGIEEMDIVIVAMGENFAQSILITSLLKKYLKVPHVIARAITQIHEDILKLIGADKVILPERDIGIRLANKLALPTLDLVSITDKFATTQIESPESFIGKTIPELQLKKIKQIECIAIRKKDEDFLKLANDNYIIAEGDQLVLAGENSKLANFVKSQTV